MRLPRLLLWVLRVAWATLPFAVGPALAAALDARSDAVGLTASVGLWAVWSVVEVATLVPHPVSLTVVRVGAPAALAAALLAVVDGHASTIAAAGAMAAAAVLVGTTFLPETAMPFVNGPAYPNERRFPLRVPGPLVLGSVEVAWVLVVGPPVGGALLAAAGRWVPAGAVLGLGAPVAVVAARSLHALSRRWVVFVPAGVVLHDPLALADPVLFPKRVMTSLHLAPAGTDSLDLTRGAFGMALELVLGEKVPMVLGAPRGRAGESGASARLLFSPTRPGAVLAEAAARGLPVA